VQAVKVIANLEAKNGGAEILEDIHKSMVRAHSEPWMTIARQW